MAPILQWFEHNLLPNRPPGAAIVMDNASYHSVRNAASVAPTSSSRKSDMQAWLTERKIHWTAGMLKSELYHLKKFYKPEPQYVVDDMACNMDLLLFAYHHITVF